MNIRAVGLFALAAYSMSVGIAAAQDQPDGVIQGEVSAGAGILPEYEGASSYMAVPYFDGQANMGRYFLRFEDGALHLNILGSEQVHFGPLLGVRLDRGNVSDPAVARMHHISYSGTVGGFLEYEHLAKDPRSGERMTLSFSDGILNEQSGWNMTLRGLVHRPHEFVDAGLIATLEVDTTWGDSRYMQTYFGVDSVDAVASGFPQFHAASGLSNVGIALALDQFLSRKWSIGLRLHYARELDAAADSPLTAIAGTPDQLFGGVVIGYVL